MYDYGQMRLYSLEEALFLKDLIKTLRGYYWCYPDNVEKEILINPSEDDIKEMYSRHIYLGNEERYDPVFFESEGVIIEEDMTTEELALIINGGGSR